MLQKIEYFLYAYCVVAFSIIFISWLKDKFTKKSPPAKKTNEKLIQIQKRKDFRTTQQQQQSLRFSVEANGKKNGGPLTQANFKTLISEYFVATDYLLDYIDHRRGGFSDSVIVVIMSSSYVFSKG